MLIRVPDYYDRFRCLAGACPHTCCEAWEVLIDGETAARYQELSGPLGEKLRQAMAVDEEGDVCFPLSGGRCPFLDGENLCEIHRELGEEATSVTCQEHPRFTEDYGSFREISLSASCPAANALLLGSSQTLTFCTRETAEDGEKSDPWTEALLPVRERMLTLLADRSKRLRKRLADVLLLAAAAQELLDQEEIGKLPALASSWQSKPWAAENGGVFPAVLHVLKGLDILDPAWQTLLDRAEKAAPIPVPDDLLERTAAYFIFRYPLKAVNDGDLLGRAAFCVLAVLTVERTAAVCGLPEALRQFSREIEHSPENLEAIQNAFWSHPGLQLPQLLGELAR